MLIKDQDQRLKRKILKNISKKKKYKNYNIEYFVNWTFEKLSNSQFEEILDNMTSLLPSEYLTKAILKDVEEISFLEKTLLVYSIIKETIKSIFDSESFSKQSEINHFYLIYMFGSGEKSHIAPIGKSQFLTNEKNQNYPNQTSFLE